jgi:hypothetical protein
MEDRYLYKNEAKERLWREYKKQGFLYVAFDFDNTIYDKHQQGDTYPEVINLLLECAKLHFHLTLFTERVSEDYIFAVTYSNNLLGVIAQHNSAICATKPHYDILLDDRAGLREAYKTLKYVIDRALAEQTNNISD